MVMLMRRRREEAIAKRPKDPRRRTQAGFRFGRNG
jgi:hypothetical protein